ncbi:hypothetical protein ABQF35_25390 [Mycobacterium syngnathidarum]
MIERRMAIGVDGYARSCGTDEPGMLLIAPGPDDAPSTREVLRGVFDRDDAWVVSGDVFSRDGDGDYWYVGPAAQMLPYRGGAIVPRQIEDALMRLRAVRLAACFQAPGEPGDTITAVALTLRAGTDRPGEDDIRRALVPIAVEPKQLELHFLDEMSMTPSFRPDPTGLRSTE